MLECCCYFSTSSGWTIPIRPLLVITTSNNNMHKQFTLFFQIFSQIFCIQPRWHAVSTWTWTLCWFDEESWGGQVVYFCPGWPSIHHTQDTPPSRKYRMSTEKMKHGRSEHEQRLKTEKRVYNQKHATKTDSRVRHVTVCDYRRWKLKNKQDKQNK